MDSPLAMLGFLSIFHVIGAVALANGLRGVWSMLRGKGRGGCRSLFFVVWGAMFGCLPFGLGLELATEEGGTFLVLFGEALIWGSVFLVALLAWDTALDWLRPFLHRDMWPMLFGGSFMVVGIWIGGSMARDGQMFGLLLGGTFALVGGVIFAAGVWSYIKAKR